MSRSSPASIADVLERIGAELMPDDPALVPWFRQYRTEHMTRLGEDLEIVERHGQGRGRILEYGAVPLLMTAALSALDYDVSAVDVAPERFSGAIGRLGLDVTKCDVEVEPVPFEDDTFDIVLFNELFEHLRVNPIFTLSEVRRVLKPGGRLVLSTPNLRSFRGIRNLLVRHRASTSTTTVYAEYEKLETLGHMGHVREYTTREVSEFLDRLGFHTEHVIFRGGHGVGLVGVAERLLPGFRPSFSLIATKRRARRDTVPGSAYVHSGRQPS